MSIRRTDKQEEIMTIILKAADTGEFLSVGEIHDRLSYTCAYGSLRTSLRFLVRHGMLIREKAGTFSIMKPTPTAYVRFRAG